MLKSFLVYSKFIKNYNWTIYYDILLTSYKRYFGFVSRNFAPSKPN